MQYQFELFGIKTYHMVWFECSNNKTEIIMGPDLQVIIACSGVPDAHHLGVVHLQHWLIQKQNNVYIWLYV